MYVFLPRDTLCLCLAEQNEKKKSATEERADGGKSKQKKNLLSRRGSEEKSKGRAKKGRYLRFPDRARSILPFGCCCVCLISFLPCDCDGLLWPHL
jgi:hypothetical protein